MGLGMHAQTPAWFQKQLKEIEDRKRCELPCLGVVVERKFSSPSLGPDVNIYRKVCARCGAIFEEGDAD